MSKYFDIEGFKCAFEGGARSNQYRVIPIFPKALDVECLMGNPQCDGVNQASMFMFMCRAASIPPSILSEISVHYRGKRFGIAGERQFGNWSVTLYNDVSFNLKNIFESWSDLIKQHINNAGVSTPSKYKGSFIVEHLGRSGETIKQYMLHGCYPVNVGQIDLSYDEQTSIEEFECEFNVDYWTAATHREKGILKKPANGRTTSDLSSRKDYDE